VALSLAAVLALQSPQASAIVPGGTNVLHVPMAWCVLGTATPARAAPNILGEGTATADTTTDAVIWRRHERPTDNIYLPQATISLRSAINDAWGTFNFPLINDSDTARGVNGDVNGWNVNTDGAEFTTAINNCDTAYANAGRAGIGITAVNVDLFHDNANPGNDGNTTFNYVTVIGWGGCAEAPAGTCVTPYDGRIAVIDNHYLYPTVANRNWPGTTTQFTLTDPLDGLVAHEAGHALSLDHRALATALMNPGITDNNSDGRADNIALNAAEVTALRANAANVPGLETDPPGEFQPGSILAMRLMDGPRDRALQPGEDLAAVTASLELKRQQLHTGAQLWGLLSCKPGTSTRVDYFLDADNNAATGASAGVMTKLGFTGSRFRGADLLVQATITGSKTAGRDFRTCQAKSRAWIAQGAKLAAVPATRFDLQIQTMRVYPHFAPSSNGQAQPKDIVAELWNTIDMRIDNRLLGKKAIRPKVPFRAQAVIVGPQRKTGDPLGKPETGGRFVLESPRFPHCFPAGAGVPGGTVDVKFDGLRPNTEIHALLGPNEVLRVVRTDAAGAGEIKLPIPAGTRPGLHLVTIGHDGLALTADCTVTVNG
jgi:hypothetical protein